MRNYVHTTERRRAYDDADSFIDAATRVHAGHYRYDKTIYINAHTKVDIICGTHGVFQQTPTNHVQGKGCPRCKAEAFGARHRSSLDDFISKALLIWGSRWSYAQTIYTGARDLLTIGCPLHGLFQQTQSNHLSGKVGCTRCNHMQSRGEDQIAALMATWTEVKQRDRQILRPREIDIYLPEKKLAIEYCGEYWHSHGTREEEKQNKLKHHQKYVDCQAQGIRLLTIYESEWVNRNYAIRRLLRNAVGKGRGKLMARKCELRSVPSIEAQAFYERYHPQGGAGAGRHYGLYWKNKLVACMRFTLGANDRGATKERTWTLTRYATRVTVAGGASRLFKAFLGEVKPKEVKSFSDNRYFGGGMYEQLGFVLEEEALPDYQVWSPKLGLRPKSHYQRRLLPRRLEDHGLEERFDPTTDLRTEMEMTFLMGARRLYDCGRKRWVWSA